MGQERRRFSRYEIPEDALAFDDLGRQVGRVETAGGGGMQVRTPSEDLARELQAVGHVRITVMEPGSSSTNTIDVRVCYRQGETLGLEFYTGEGAEHS